MGEKYKGSFSANILSLELQIKTLLEESGGDHAISLLDALSNLNKSEQDMAIKMFTRVINQVLAGDERLLTEDDKAAKDFEEKLYEELLSSMREAANSNRKLRVLSGGRAQLSSKNAISLSEARKHRGLRLKTVLN